MELHFIRHATLFASYQGLNLLVDPMFSPIGALNPVANSPNQQRNPLVDLPTEDRFLRALIDRLDAILVTHTHFDHWDDRARDLLPKHLTVFCQPEDALKIQEAGFEKTNPVEVTTNWRGLDLHRTGGHHGTGEIGRRMGPVSGFVLSAQAEPTLYIAGDTIWCDEVFDALQQHTPGVIVVNAGAAQFNQGKPITMTAADVGQVCRTVPTARVVAVHMQAINHCLLSRDELATELKREVASGQLLIPRDGQRLFLES